MRLEPRAIGAARRRACATAARSSRRPTARRRPPRWSRRSSRAPARASSTTAPARTWRGGVADRAARRRARVARSTATPGCSRSTSSGWTRSSRELRPRALLLRQPLPRPARPLRRARDDRRPLGGGGRRARPRRALVLNADDPLVADLGRDRAGVTYFGVEDDARRARRDGSTRRTPSTAAAAARRTSTTPSTWATSGATTAPTATAPRPQPGVWRADDRRSTARAPRASAAPRRRRRARRAPPARPLQRLQRARRRRADARRSASSSTRSSPACRRREAAFGRAETVVRRRPRARDPARQEPGRRQRGAAHARARAGEHDVFAVLNDRIADGRDVSWIWDADFELSPTRVRRVTCSGTRAAELALRLKYAGVPADRLHVVPDARGRPRRRAGAAADGRLVALPTYTAMLELRGLLVARGAATGSFAMSAGHLARRRVRRATPPTCRCGASSPRGGRAGPRRRRRHRPRGARPRARRPPRRRARPRAGAARRAARARAGAACRSRPSSPTRAGFDLGGRAFGAHPRADADDPAARRRAGRAAFLRLRARAPGARRAASRSRWPTRSSRSTADDAARCRRPTARASTAGAVLSQPVALRDDGERDRDRARARRS